MVRLEESPTSMRHQMVNILPSERFVYSGQQTTPLMRYQEFEPDNIMGTTSSSLLGALLKALTPHDTPNGVVPVAESSTSPALLPTSVPPARSALLPILYRGPPPAPC